MNIRLVKKRAFTNDEVTRRKAVIQSERRMRDRLRRLEDENAQDALSRSNFLRQLWATAILSFVSALCGFGDIDVCVAVIKPPTKTAFRLRATA